MVANKTKTMQENTLPGVNWIPSKLLRETVEQIGTTSRVIIINRDQILLLYISNTSPTL